MPLHRCNPFTFRFYTRTKCYFEIMRDWILYLIGAASLAMSGGAMYLLWTLHPYDLIWQPRL